MLVRMTMWLYLAAMLSVAYGQADRIEVCPSLSIMDPFQISNFTGTWYKQFGMNTPWELGSCMKTTYTQDSDTGVISVTSSHKTMFGVKDHSSGTLMLANTSSTDGILIVTTTHSFLGAITGEMWILDSDYDNYAIAYFCKDMFSIPIEAGWVFSRQQTLTKESAQLITTAMTKIAEEGGPSLSDMKTVSQKRCP